jgi:hypothetical protein
MLTKCFFVYGFLYYNKNMFLFLEKTIRHSSSDILSLSHSFFVCNFQAYKGHYSIFRLEK